jgi:hypothetical protein
MYFPSSFPQLISPAHFPSSFPQLTEPESRLRYVYTDQFVIKCSVNGCGYEYQYLYSTRLLYATSHSQSTRRVEVPWYIHTGWNAQSNILPVPPQYRYYLYTPEGLLLMSSRRRPNPRTGLFCTVIFVLQISRRNFVKLGAYRRREYKKKINL